MTVALSSAPSSPPATAGERLYQAIGLVRRLFHQLGRATDELHRDLEVTAAQRAVLEVLVESGPVTVPVLARSKRVSRQHIQVIANDLIAAGLAEPAENPAHRRSQLVGPTDAGRKVFAAMRARERSFLRSMAQTLGPRDVARTVRTLEAMSAYLESRAVTP